MKKYTVDEKLEYNYKKKGLFSAGYVYGVISYRDYPKANSEYRKLISDSINNASAGAKKGDEFSRGLMCGVRDAANERKAKIKKRK